MILEIILIFYFGLIDVWCFFKISKIKVNKAIVAILLIFITVLGSLTMLGNWGCNFNKYT